MRLPPIVLLPVLVSALALTGCVKRTKPPGDVGICFHVVPQKDGTLKYNKLVTAKSLEVCAANLEALRIRFSRMTGGGFQNIYGAYQSNYLFLTKDGVATGTSLEGPRFTALVRTGDGRLAIPGAMPQAPR